MRHIPIAIIIALSGVIIYLTHEMQDHPYTTESMRGAYYHGCNFGTVYGAELSNRSVKRCQDTSFIFKTGIE